MSIAINEDHRALADTAREFLASRKAFAAARALLEAKEEERPPFWGDLAEIGWLGLHIPEQHGGSGFGMEERVVVVEELGRVMAPGPFVPTVIASAVIAVAADDATKANYLKRLADGSTAAAVSLAAGVTIKGGKVSGAIGAVVGAGLADIFLLSAGDDVA